MASCSEEWAKAIMHDVCAEYAAGKIQDQELTVYRNQLLVKHCGPRAHMMPLPGEEGEEEGEEAREIENPNEDWEENWEEDWAEDWAEEWAEDWFIDGTDN